MTAERVKDPRFVAAGKKGMLSRWGPPRRAYLGDFTPEQRRIVLALIDAQRNKFAAEAKKEPATVGDELPGSGQEVRRAVGDPQTD